MVKTYLILIILVLAVSIILKCRKEPYYDVNITERGLRLDPLFVNVPKHPSQYKGYIDYPKTELLELCPSIKKKQDKESVKCETRLDCGPAEVCVHDGVSSYCQCSISNDCIEAGVC